MFACVLIDQSRLINELLCKLFKKVSQIVTNVTTPTCSSIFPEIKSVSQPRCEVKSVLMILLVSVLLVSGCAPINDALPITRMCTKTLDLGVWDLNGERIYQDHAEVDLVLVETRLGSNTYNVQGDLDDYNNRIAKMNQAVGNANTALLEQLFESTPALAVKMYRWETKGWPLIEQETYYPDLTCSPAQYFGAFNWFGEYRESNAGYRTYPVTVGDTFYVSMSNPGKSWVQYAFPAKWFNEIVRSEFLDEGFPKLLETQSISQSETIQLDDKAFEASMLASVAGQLNEVVAFRFATEDFQGRKELRPAIVRALALAMVEDPNARFMYVGKFGAESRAFAQVTYTKNDFYLTGWRSFLGGEIKGGGGGGSGEGTYNASTNEFLEGSIYVLPNPD